VFVLVTGDGCSTGGRMGTSQPHDARGWLGGEPRAGARFSLVEKSSIMGDLPGSKGEHL